MVRLLILGSALGCSACAAEESGQHVVRFDLEKIAAETAARDTSPGFTDIRQYKTEAASHLGQRSAK